MSASMNRATIMGNVGSAPKMGQTKSNIPYCVLSVATNEVVGKQQITEWHDVVAFGKLAEVCGRYLNKGRHVYAEGRIQTSQFVASDGSKQRRTKIVAQSVKFLDPVSMNEVSAADADAPMSEHDVEDAV
jgi:single-strand DNA-binding protein